MTQTQQAITEALRAIASNVREALAGGVPLLACRECFIIWEASQAYEGHRKTCSVGIARAALRALESASPAEPSAQKVIDAARCIHHWHDTANGGMIVSGEKVRELWDALESYDAKAPAEGKGGDTYGQLPPVESAPASAVEAGAEDANPPACDCPARTAISELLKCPDGRSLTWPEIDEICRAALSAPCPTAELRDEIAQHNLWRAEAYRQLAQKDAEIARLSEILSDICCAVSEDFRGADPVKVAVNLIESMRASQAAAETAEASLAALKQEAAEILEPFARGAKPATTMGLNNSLAFVNAAALYERLKAEREG